MPMSESFQDRLFPNLPRIVEHFGTPFHIYDEKGIRKTLQSLIGAFCSRRIDFKEFYAVKALPKLDIMHIIKSEDCGFDCSSIPELRLAYDVQATPDDIMFTSNNTSQEEFKEAMTVRCILNLDDEIFIDKIPGNFPELVSFRLNPGNRKTGDEVNSIIGNPVDSKYGVPIENIVRAYGRAKGKGATSFGLHTMVCSNDLDYTHLVSTLSLLLEVSALIYRELGIRIQFVNVGGGVGIPYRLEDKSFNMEGFAEAAKILLLRFEAFHRFVPKLYMESGRYVTGPHGVLVNRVINVYEKYKSFVGVEVAMPALMRVGMYSSAYHHCTVLDKNFIPKDGPTRIVTIAGSICENCDVLARDILLPVVEEGDYIITHDTGAHGSAMGFNYNGRTRPQELLLNDHSVLRIGVAETYEDLERHGDYKEISLS
ncbi:MAG: diaminopimelate decarboxylase [bacterium]|nr:diaminopimelate decarboxylase [bacterium]